MEKIKEMFNENYFYIKEKVKVTLKELYPYIVIMIVVMLFRTFIATPVRVDGISMVDTLHDGEILILNKLDKSYKRFDIVVINYGDTKIVKRIIGLPGENIEYKDNELYINNSKIEDKAIARTNDFTLKGIYDGLEKIPDDKDNFLSTFSEIKGMKVAECTLKIDDEEGKCYALFYKGEMLMIMPDIQGYQDMLQ